MKLMNRCLAFSLCLLLTLHSFYLPAWANSGEEDVIDWSEYGLYPVTINDMYGNNVYYPGDDHYPYPIRSDISFFDDSSGDEPGDPVLTDGTIADAIATGVGIYYDSHAELDALGSLLIGNLQAAAEGRTLGRTQLESWLSWAQQGTIKLQSAPSWIYESIMETLYGIYFGEKLPYVSSYPQGAQLPLESGSVIPAGTRYFMLPSYYPNSYWWEFSEDVVLIRRYQYSPNSNGTFSFVFSLKFFSLSSFTFNYHDFASLSSGSSKLTAVGPLGNGMNYYSDFTLSSNYSDSVFDEFSLYYIPGAVDSTLGYTDRQIINAFNSGVPLSSPIPLNGEVPPDAMFGGIVKIWQDGVDASSIKLPDINLGDRTSADVSALTQQVYDGTITWTDFWTLVAGKVPSVDTGDGIFNIDNDGLGDTFLGESEDTTVKGIFALLGDLFAKITGSEEDRNAEIDSGLPGASEDMDEINDFESEISDQLTTEFEVLDINNFALSTSVLSAIAWITGWVTNFFNVSGDAQIILILPMFIGLALLFIGRGSVAMSRVHAAHLRAASKTDKGGGSS